MTRLILILALCLTACYQTEELEPGTMTRFHPDPSPDCHHVHNLSMADTECLVAIDDARYCLRGTNCTDTDCLETTAYAQEVCRNDYKAPE